MKIFVFALLFLVSTSVFAAADLPPMFPTGSFTVGLYALDASTGRALANQLIVYSFKQQKGLSVVTTVEQTDANGSLTAYLDEGVWNFFAEADDYTTPGKDFAASGEINVSKDFSLFIYFQEVASVSGEVVDEQGNLVSNAQLGLKCIKASDAQSLNDGELASDANGNFMLRFVPTGACRITAFSDSKTGFVDVDLKRGELKQTRITLKNTVGQESEQINLLLLILLVILTALVLVFFYFKRVRKTTEPKMREDREKLPAAAKTAKTIKSNGLKVTKKIRIVLNALNERERSIVELLLANKGRMKQAKIARELLIPKTSLLRAVQSLEKRNIVKTMPLGKHKIVEFTDWFKSL